MNKEKNLFLTIEKLANNKDVSGIRLLSEQNNPIDLAEAFSNLDDNLLLFCFRSLKEEQVGEVLSHLDVKSQVIIISDFNRNELKKIFVKIFNDDLVEIIVNLPEEYTNKILLATNKQRRKELDQILQYLENTAGSIMTTEYIYLFQDWTVKQALNQVKNLGQERIETYSNIYVINREKNLIGVINLSDLIFATANKKVKSLVKNAPISVDDKSDQEEVANLMKKYEVKVLPVINKKNQMLGIITIDDILNIVEEEATEDIHRMAAVAPTFKEYSKTTVWSLFKSRVFWLLILMIAATISQLVIENNSNSDTTKNIESGIITLTALIPLMTGTAGNAGGQSGATIIRALSTNDIEIKDYWKVIWKEVVVASLIGSILFFANYLRMIILGKSIQISFITSLAVFITIIFAKLLGASLPIFAKKMRLDPAVVAAPLITTIIDLSSIVILFYVYRLFIF